VEIHLLSSHNFSFFKTLVVKSTWRRREARKPKPPVNIVESVDIQVAFEEGAWVGRNQMDRVMTAIYCWEERYGRL
jgi:hypothetical protein